jgi:hypothetical protein
MASSRIIQLGRTPNTSAANAATAPVANVHINHPKPAVMPAEMRASADRDLCAGAADDDGMD